MYGISTIIKMTASKISVSLLFLYWIKNEMIVGKINSEIQ